MATVIQAQDQIEVYTLASGSIAIRSISNGEEQVIVIAKENILLLCSALISAKKELSNSGEADA